MNPESGVVLALSESPGPLSRRRMPARNFQEAKMGTLPPFCDRRWLYLASTHTHSSTRLLAHEGNWHS